MINLVVLQGRLVYDPILRYTQNNVAVCSVRIACADSYKKGVTHFFNVVTWRHTAEYISKYGKKGSLVTVQGRLKDQETEFEVSGETKNYHYAEIEATDVVCHYTSENVRQKNEETNEPQFTPLDNDGDDGDLPC